MARPTASRRTPLVPDDPGALGALFDFSRRLMPLDTTGDIAVETLGAVLEGTGARFGSVWLRTIEEGLLSCVCCEGSEPSASVGALPAAWIARFTESPLLALEEPDSGADPLPGWLRERLPLVIFPLAEEDTLHGIVAIQPPGGTFDVGDTRGVFGTEAARLAASALHRVGSRQPARDGAHSEAAEVYRGRYPALQKIVGDSPQILELYRNLLAVAPASCTVILVGETGSGKELAARVLHELSGRREGPFIEVDCGAIPQDLIESELFGHSKGAFTGATSDRRGVFEMADGGTLFLDEVANLPLQTQNRLLRVLQERRFRPVGSEVSVEVDVRVVAASNQDLRDEVEEGSFREDLFYRLYVYPIRIPPLRDRPGDIPTLANHYLERCARENRLGVPRMDAGFLERFITYSFPGNVRELRHLVERSLLRSAGRSVVTSEVLDEAISEQPATHSPAGPAPAREGAAVGRTPPPLEGGYPRKAGVERGMWVMEVLRRQRFNVKASAEALTERAHRDPEDPPPLTDRSSLTYYFQVECFRIYLECGGNLEEAASVIAGDSEGSVPTIRRRLAGYLKSARLVVAEAAGPEDAHRVLREKFLKLPEDYLTVLDELADHLRETASTHPQEV